MRCFFPADFVLLREIGIPQPLSEGHATEVTAAD